LGKITEYAICILLNTPFEGKYKYEVGPAEVVAKRMGKNGSFVRDHYGGCVHSGAKDPITGEKNPAHDFINKTDTNKQLSVKSIKTGAWKISPAKIGQPSSKKFQQAFSLLCDDPDKTKTNTQIKEFIEKNTGRLVEKYFEHTFHCPMLFYHQKKDICMHISVKPVAPIHWENLNYTFSHIQKKKEWNESTTLSVIQNGKVSKALGEFQVHNHRDCIKFRFDLQTLLDMFPDSFEIVHL